MRRRHTIPVLLTSIAVVVAGCLPGTEATTTDALAGAEPAAAARAADQVTLVAKADAWTAREMADTRTGGQWVLRALSGQRLRRSWVSFDVPPAPVAGATVASAVLTMPVKFGTGSVKVEIAESSTWSEGTISYRTEPRIDRWVGRGTVQDGKVVAGLTNAVWPGMPRTFVVSHVENDKEIVFHSRESGNGPTLTVTWNLPTETTPVTAVPAPTTTTTAAPTTTTTAPKATTTTTAPPAPTTTTTAPPAPRTSVPFGMNWAWESGSTNPELFAKAQAKYGTFDIVRVFHPGLPKGWNTFYGSIPQPQVTSFKVPPAEILSGKHDAYLRNWFATAPRDRVIYWSFHPEPEDDIEKGDYTAAQFRAANQRIDALADEAKNPNLRSTLILMYWTANPLSGRSIDDYYPGTDAVDVIAWDSYNWGASKGRYPSANEMFDRLISIARAKGEKVAFAEFGSLLVSGDDGRGRAAWLRSMADHLEQQGVEFVTYWNDSIGGLDYRLLDSHSAQAWRDVMAR